MAVDEMPSTPLEHQHAPTASSSASSGRPTGWPLLHLPAPGVEPMLDHLTAKERKDLRLVSKAALALVDAHVRRLQLNLAAGQQPMGLPERYPSVTSLSFLSHPLQRQPGFSISGWELWDSITRLRLPDLPASCVAVLAAGCPNVTECVLHASMWPSAGHWRESLRVVCSGLPRLASLTTEGLLGDAEISIIASCSSLTAVAGNFSYVSARGWAALAGLAQLAAFEAHLEDDVVPASGAMSALQALKQLTRLTIHAPDDLWPKQAMLDAGLQLPTTLHCLSLQWWPLPAVPVLPQLTSLCLDSSIMVDHVALRALAKAQLQTLKVDCLALVPVCHTTPLLAATQLVVTHRFSVAKGARLALTCPALRALVLQCHCELADGARVLEGMTALERLECSYSFEEGANSLDDHPGLSLTAPELQLLAGLPSLAVLRLNASVEHLQQWQALTCLQRLEWVFAGRSGVSALNALRDAMREMRVPEQVNFVSFMFEHPPDNLEEYGFDAYELMEIGMHALQRYQAFTSVIDAALALVALRAPPSLTAVRWEVDTSVTAAMNDVRLLALASNPSITLIEIVRGKHTTPAAAIEQVMRLHASRGLKVVVTDE